MDTREEKNNQKQEMSATISRIIESEKLVDGVALLADAGLNIDIEVLAGLGFITSRIKPMNVFDPRYR